jgi:O-Antigen ligase
MRDEDDERKPTPVLKADQRALDAIARFESRAKTNTVPNREMRRQPVSPPQQAIKHEPAQAGNVLALPSITELWGLLQPQHVKLSTSRIVLALPFAVIAIFLFAYHPLLGLPLLAFVLLYCAALWMVPLLWIILLPSMISLVDLSPWSGWWFFDEFDGLWLLTIAILIVRLPLERNAPPWPKRLLIPVLAISVSYIIAILMALLPWPGITLNSFNSYLSPFNALRIAKGFFYIALLLPWLVQASRQGKNTLYLLIVGLIASLALVSLYVIFERWRLVGLFNLKSVYRSVGPFFSMHTGDGHIDVWLATVTPLLAACLFLRPRILFWVAGAGVGFMAIYAVITTGSRGPFLAIGAGLALAIAALFAQSRLSWRWLLGAVVICFVIAGPGASLVRNVLANSYLGDRFKTISADADYRENHWKNALALRDDNLTGRLFGSGLGRFPSLWQKRADSAGAPEGSYSFATEDGNRYLHLTPGVPIYFQQMVDIDKGQLYHLKMRARSDVSAARVEFSLCQKWILVLTNTVDCEAFVIPMKGVPGNWHNYTLDVPVKIIGTKHWRFGKWATAPIWLTVRPMDKDAPVDFDDIQLTNKAGVNLLRNSDFARANDYWFWVSYEHLSYHTKNLVVNILLDLGWFGLLAIVLTLAATATTLIQQWQTGNRLAAAWLGGLAGLLIVATTVSLFDAPRLAMLFYLMLLAPLAAHASADKRKIT